MFSPLQLRRSVFTEVSIRTIPNGDFAGEVEFNPTITAGHRDDDQRFWRVEVSLKIESSTTKPFAYEGIITAVGFFEVEPGFASNDLHKAVAVNGASMIYGMIREMVLAVTARSEKDELMIPTADFRGLAPAEKKASPSAKRKPPAPETVGVGNRRGQPSK